MLSAQATYQQYQRGSRDDLVLQHAALVKRTALHLKGRLPPSQDLDDLIQAGMIGLLEAASHFLAEKGASFETYATIRIRGAMILFTMGAWMKIWPVAMAISLFVSDARRKALAVTAAWTVVAVVALGLVLHQQFVCVACTACGGHGVSHGAGGAGFVGL